FSLRRARTVPEMRLGDKGLLSSRFIRDPPTTQISAFVPSDSSSITTLAPGSTTISPAPAKEWPAAIGAPLKEALPVTDLQVAPKTPCERKSAAKKRRFM